MSHPEVKEGDFWATEKSFKVESFVKELQFDYLCQQKQSKNKQNYIKLKNFCIAKETNQQTEKTTNRMEGNICILYIWQELIIRICK